MRNLKLNYLFLLLALILIFGSLGNAQSGKERNIPRGRIETFQFKDSKIFPGTEREVSVYIPAQIDLSKPACVYVQQDGLNPKQQLTEILDTLIANNEMPATVGIFIRPGSLPPSNRNTLNRPNRCFEYDGVGDNYVRFLLEEILPDVSVRYKLNLSNNGNDRCIGGVSSGGISAFNTA
jgi:gluconolactonase